VDRRTLLGGGNPCAGSQANVPGDQPRGPRHDDGLPLRLVFHWRGTRHGRWPRGRGSAVRHQRHPPVRTRRIILLRGGRTRFARTLSSWTDRTSAGLRYSTFFLYWFGLLLYHCAYFVIKYRIGLLFVRVVRWPSLTSFPVALGF